MHRVRIVLTALWLLAFSSSITLAQRGGSPLTDNQPAPGVEFDGLVPSTRLALLEGLPILLKLKSGLLIRDASLETLQFDPRLHGLKFVKYRLDTGRVVTAKAVDISALRIARENYRLRYYPPNQQLYLVNQDLAMNAAASRLSEKNAKPMELLDDDEQAAATEEHRGFLRDAIKKLSGPFRIEETKTTLILTDVSPALIRPLGVYADQLNDQLAELFGIPVGDSIWRGKAIIAAFSTPAGFAEFEVKVFDNPNHGGTTGVRSGDQRFVQTMVITEINTGVLRGIGWGYSLGFAHRLHSDLNDSSVWMRMGIASLLGSLTTNDTRRLQSQRVSVADRLKQQPSLRGVLNATRIDQALWPMCGQLVHSLMVKDTTAMGQLFRDLKLGVSLDDALVQNFGVTPEQFAAQFGQSLGVAGVVP